MFLAKLRYKALVATAALLLTSVPVLAGQYELVKGKGVEVCEAYAKNLNSFRPKVPMTCSRKINPEFKDFTKPNWSRLVERGSYGDPSQDDYGILMESVDRFLWERDANPVGHIPVTEWPKWKGTKAQYAQAWEGFQTDRHLSVRSMTRFVAEIDIDHDGTPEPVYFEQDCGSVWGSLLLVLTPDYRDIDKAKSALVMRHPSRKEAGWGVFQPVKKGDWGINPDSIKRGYALKEDSLHGAHYGVFQYKGKTYIDLWWVLLSDYRDQPDYVVGRLRVFTAEKNHVNEICTYRFESNDR